MAPSAKETRTGLPRRQWWAFGHRVRHRKLVVPEPGDRPGRGVEAQHPIQVGGVGDGSRLLTAGDGAIEVAHEALLEHWPRFREWLAEDAEGRRLHRHLTEAAVQWSAAGRHRGAVPRGAVERGARLGRGRRPRPGPERPRARVPRRRAAPRRSENRSVSTQAHRRLRLLLGCALALMLAALGAGAVAWQQGRQADRQATAAVAGRLGAQALIEPSLDRSLLLARAGVSLDDSSGGAREPARRARAQSGCARGHLGERRSRPRRRGQPRRPPARGRRRRRQRRPLRHPHAAAQSDARSAATARSARSARSAKPIHALAFSPDGRTLAIASTTGHLPTISLVDTGTHALRWTRTSTADVTTTDVAFAPDGRTLVAGESVTGDGQPTTRGDRAPRRGERQRARAIAPIRRAAVSPV